MGFQPTSEAVEAVEARFRKAAAWQEQQAMERGILKPNAPAVWQAAKEFYEQAAEAERDRLKGELENEYGRAEAFKHSLKVRTAERDRLAGRAEELEGQVKFWKDRYDTQHGTVHRLEDRVAELDRAVTKVVGERDYWKGAANSLAALAGEDDGPPQPQREGDYL